MGRRRELRMRVTVRLAGPEDSNPDHPLAGLTPEERWEYILQAAARGLREADRHERSIKSRGGAESEPDVTA